MLTSRRAQVLLRALPAAALLSAVVAVGALTAVEPGGHRSYLLGTRTQSLAEPTLENVLSKEWMRQIDDWSSQNVPQHALWLEMHAAMEHRVLRSPVVGGTYVNGPNGMMFLTYDGHPVTEEFRANARALSEAASANGVPLVWVYAPRKEEAFVDVLPEGWPHPLEDNRADTLAALDTGDTVIDLSEIMRDPTRRDDLYYRTDHHWTPLAAWLAVQEIADAVGALGVEWGTDDREYVRVDSDITMLGSMGRRATLQATPNPDIYWTYEPVGGWRSFSCKGEDEDCTLPPINAGYLEDPNPYADRYLSFVHTGLTGPGQGHYVNSSPEARGTVLLLEDSFGAVMDAIVAERSRELWVVEERRYLGADFIDLIARLQPDVIIVVHNQNSLLDPEKFDSNIWSDAPALKEG